MLFLTSNPTAGNIFKFIHKLCRCLNLCTSEEKEHRGGLCFVEILDLNSGFAKLHSELYCTGEIFPALIAWLTFTQNTCFRSE